MNYSKRAKSLFRFIFGVGFFLFALSLFLNLVADNFYTNRFIRNIVNEKLSGVEGVSVTYRALNFRVVPFKLEVFGIDLKKNEEDIISASQIKVSLAAANIFLGKEQLIDVSVSGLKFAYPDPIKKLFEKTDDEPLHLPKVFPTSLLNSISLKNAEIEYFDSDVDLKYVSKDFNSKLVFESSTSIKGSITSNSTFFSLEEFVLLKNGKVSLGVDINPDELVSSPFFIYENGASLKGNFEIKPFLRKNRALHGLDVSGIFTGTADMFLLTDILGVQESKGPTDLKGDFLFPARFGRDMEFKIHSNVRAKAGQIGGFKVYDTTADLYVDKTQILFEKGRVLNRGRNLVDFTGRLPFENKEYFNFKLQPKNIPLAELLDALKVKLPVLSGNLKGGEIDIKGLMKPFTMNITGETLFDRFRVTPFKLPAEKYLSCQAKLNLFVDTNAFSFKKNNLECLGSTTRSPSMISLIGDLSFDQKKGINLKVQSDDFNFNLLSDVLGMSFGGRGKLKQNVIGPYTDVKLVHEVESNDLFFSHLRLGQVKTLLTVDKLGVIYWNNFISYLPNRGVLKSSSGNMKPGYIIETDIDAVDIQESTISEFNQTFIPASPFLFSLDKLKGSLKGPLLYPAYQEQELDFQLSNMKYLNRMLAHKFVGSLRSSDINFSLFNSSYTYNDLVLRVNVDVLHSKYEKNELKIKNSKNIYRLLPKDIVHIDIESRKMAMSKSINVNQKEFFDHVQQLPVIGEKFVQLGFESRLEGVFGIHGPWENLGFKGRFNLRDPRVHSQKLSDFIIDSTYINSKIDTTFSQLGGGLAGRFTSSTSYGKQNFDVYLKMTQFDVRAFLPSSVSNDIRNHAYLSSDFKMSGVIGEPRSMDGQLDLKEFHSGFFSPTSGRMINFHLDNSRSFHVGSGRFNIIDTNSLSFSGDGLNILANFKEYQDLDSLNIDLNGSVDFSLLPLMTTQIDQAGGRAVFEGKVSGEYFDPRVSLLVTDDPGNPINLSITRPPLSQVKFKAFLKNTHLDIESFSASKGSGKISLKGRYQWVEDGQISTNLDFILSKTSFSLKAPIIKNIETEISGNVNVSGKNWPLNVVGDVEIDKAVSTRHFDLRDQIISALQRRKISGGGSTLGRPNLLFDLNLSADQSIEIYNRNLQTIISSDLHLEGSDVKPELSGQVSIVKGKFAYRYRRDFTITQGLLTFDNPDQFDPKVDILGVAEIDNYKVFAAITGRSSDSRVDLSIDPPAREDGTPISKVDILLLLSNGNLPEKQRSEVATQDAAKAEALNILVGQFEEPVEKLFDLTNQSILNQVYLDGYIGADGNPKPRANLPLNLHKDWDVIFRVDGDRNLRASLGYDIDSNVSISGNFDHQSSDTSSESAYDSNDTGVDLKFQFSFP